MAVVTFSLLTAAPVLADEVGAYVNAARPGNLPVVALADQVAEASAAGQAAAGKLYHADLSALLGSCNSVGEVVGAGPDVPAVFEGFKRSATHWNIITNPAWTAMGTGLATGGDGTAYVSVVFCSQSAGPPAAADPPPAPINPGVDVPSRVREVVANPEPVVSRPLPALGARRAEIRSRLDPQAESMLPDWYIGACGAGNRARALAGNLSDSGTCPLAS